MTYRGLWFSLEACWQNRARAAEDSFESGLAAASHEQICQIIMVVKLQIGVTFGPTLQFRPIQVGAPENDWQLDPIALRYQKHWLWSFLDAQSHGHRSMIAQFCPCRLSFQTCVFERLRHVSWVKTRSCKRKIHYNTNREFNNEEILDHLHSML